MSELDYKESWTLKNLFFWTVVLENLLRSPWTARRSNQSILKEISLEYSLEGLMLKLKLLWPPDAKSWLTEKDPDAGKDERQEEKGTDRGWDGWMALLIQWTWVWVNSGSWWRTRRPGMLQSMGSQRVKHDLADWTRRRHSIWSQNFH